MSKKTNKPKTSSPAVHCNFNEMVSIEKIVPNPKNPNGHSAAQVDLLSEIIKHRGWRNPIQVSKLSGFVVAGHCRLAAAKKLGLDSAPVDFQDFEDEADEWSHMIADNRVAELSDMDDRALFNLLDALEDRSTSGFSENEFQELSKKLSDTSFLDGEGEAGEDDSERNDIGKLPDEFSEFAIVLTAEQHQKITRLLEGIVAKEGLERKGDALMLLHDAWERNKNEN